MRYARVRVQAAEGGLHPWGQRLTEEPAVSRGPIHRLEPVDDGSAVLLAEVYGDIGRYREIAEASEYVHTVSIAGENPGYAYAHFELTPLGEAILVRVRRSELVLQLPIRVTETGAMVGTLVGEAMRLREVVEDMPDATRIEVVEVGDYEPELNDVFASLTARQQEVLRVAIDVGYFEIPREGTHEDIAERVGISAGTVGEHIRKIERQVFSHFVR